MAFPRKEINLSYQYLRAILDYDSEIGVLKWKVVRGSCAQIKPDQIAGSKGSGGYRIVMIDGVRYFAHRLIWFYVTASWPRDLVDHANMVRDDNRWCNLREATNAQNQRNLGMRKWNTSGFKGANFHHRSGKWRAAINLGNKGQHLGLFDTVEEAHAVYMKAAIEASGEFARAK